MLIEALALILLQKRLDVYLAPFIHGMSYTSYGRHFTKLDKLEEASSFIEIQYSYMIILI